MSVATKQSLAGFVAEAPQLFRSGSGVARAVMQIGQTPVIADGAGGFIDGDTQYTTVVMFRKTAERAMRLFQVNDRFIAEGQVQHFQPTDTAGNPVLDDSGAPVVREEFLARKIGHDPAFTRYTVDRSVRASHSRTVDPVLHTAPEVGQEAAGMYVSGPQPATRTQAVVGVPQAAAPQTPTGTASAGSFAGVTHQESTPQQATTPRHMMQAPTTPVAASGVRPPQPGDPFTRFIANQPPAAVAGM